MNKVVVKKTDNYNEYLFSFYNFNVQLNSAGNGLWSSEERKVNHTKAKLRVYCYDIDSSKFKINKNNSNELKIFFTKKDWDVEKFGLIYTDKRWIRELREYLKSLGFSKKASNSVDYTEQGMQGDNYVSLDVGNVFVKEFVNLLFPDY